MIHLVLPFGLAAVLAATGVYGILARRNAVLMLIGVELLLAAASTVLVTMSATLPDDEAVGQILTIFVITLAAAEVTLALGIILAAYRLRGHIDLTEPLDGRSDGRLDGRSDGPHDAPGRAHADARQEA